MDKRTKKKVTVIFAVLVLLYIFSAAPGMRCENGNMENAMKQVSQLIKEAREDIQKEMRKPFILRLFGSLFGMEGNKFDKLKRRLPPIIETAMPEFLRKKGKKEQSTEYSCTGMKLEDALSYCLENHLAPKKFYWRFDSSVVEKKYLKPALSVLASDFSGTQPLQELTLQYHHGINNEEGLPDTDTSTVDSLWKVSQIIAERSPLSLGKWICGYSQEGKVKELLYRMRLSSALDWMVEYKDKLPLAGTGR